VTSVEIRDWIETGAAIAQALAVPLTAIFAYLSLHQWRRQRRSEQDAELAEEIEIAIARVKKGIGRIRSPFGHGGEGSTRERSPDESADRSRQLDNAFAHLERYFKEGPLFDKIDELEIRANVRFKKELATEFVQLRLHVNSLALAASAIYRDARQNHQYQNANSAERAMERAERHQKTVWSESENDKLDEFDAKLHDIESRISAGLARYRL
jgi:hypothetical protein